MVSLKKTSIYFLIFLLLMGINLFKNIYIENKIHNSLEEQGLKKISSIKCNGFLSIECELRDVSFEKNIRNTNYIVNVKQIDLVDFSILKHYTDRDSFKLIVKSMRLFNSRDSFLELKKPMDLNMTFITLVSHKALMVEFFREDLELEVILDLEKNSTLTAQDFKLIDIEIKRGNDVIKKIIYELYKVKLLEIIEEDDQEFSSTRGMNIPLGIDTAKVIPQKVFLGEPFEAMSILLRSEIETLDWVIAHDKNNNIMNFVADIIDKNGVNQLQIQKEKEKKQ